MIPYPPTDSLYKFMALSGTVLAVLAVYFPDVILEKWELDVLAASEEVAVLEVETKYLERRHATVEEIIKNSIAAQNGQFKSDPTKLELTYSEEELKALMVEEKSLLRDLRVRSERFRVNQDRLDMLRRRVSSLRWSSPAGVGVGILLAIMGYYLWYTRVQRVEDRLRTSGLKHEKTG